MEKLSSYQKLKKKISELEGDIYNLVENRDEVEGIKTRTKYVLKYDTMRAMWFGKKKSDKDIPSEGLFAQMMKTDKPNFP